MGLFSFVGKLLGVGGSPQQKIEISKTSAAEGLPIIYGRRRLEAVNVFKRVSSNNIAASAGTYPNFVLAGPGTSDEDIDRPNVWLHRIDVWGQGEINAIKRFWVDGDQHTHTRFNARPYFRAISKFGTESQTAFTALSGVSPQWGSNHKGNGVAYSWTRFLNSKNKPQFTAEPILRAEIEGLKLYDPRLDSSVAGGSGTHSFDDPSTWAYGNNRALVVLNYLMTSFGFNAPRDELDLESFIVAADLCDEPMTIPLPATNTLGAQQIHYNPQTGFDVAVNIGERYPGDRIYQASDSVSQAQYVADAVIDPTDGVVDNLKILLEEFGWSLSWSNGRHRLVIENDVSAPAMTFDETAIFGGWNIERGNRSERYNRVTVSFPNANKDYENDTVSWPKLRGDQHNSYLAEDGGRDLHANLSLKTVTDFYRAEAYAEFAVRKSRVNDRITGLQLAPRAMLLEPGDVIAIDYAAKGFDPAQNLYFVERINISSALDVTVDLRTYDGTLYGASERVPELPNIREQGLNPWVEPGAITDLQAAEYHTKKADGSVISGIYLTWEAPTSGIVVERIEVKWRDIDDPNFTGDQYAGVVQLPAEATSYAIPDLPDNHHYRVVVSYVTRLLQRSIEAVLEDVDLSAAPDSKLDLIEEGATRTTARGAYDAGAVYAPGDIVTYEGSSFIARVPATNIDPTDDTVWTLLAAAGVSGGFFKNIFIRTNSTPSMPSGAAPSGWSDAPPAANGQRLWMALALFDNAGVFIGPWSTPSEIGGSGVEVQYSSNASSWHSPPFNAGSDKYMRQRLTGEASWSDAIQIVGEKGDDGAQGIQGPAGADGQPRYLWIAYASNATGTSGFTTGTPNSSHTYFGVSPNQTSAIEGTNPSAYTWKRLPNGMTEAEIAAELGWSSTPESGATRNTGDLADEDSVDTDHINSSAVSDGNYSLETVSSQTAPLNSRVTVADLTVESTASGAKQFLVTANVTLYFLGVVQVRVYLKHNDNADVQVGFIRNDVTNSGSQRAMPVSYTWRRNSSTADNDFKMKIEVINIIQGGSVKYQNGSLTAIELKR